MSSGESPHALLQRFLAKRYSDSFEDFILRRFPEAHLDIHWGKTSTELNDFILWLEARGRIPDLWPILRQERERFLDDIDELAAEWAPDQADRRLKEWLTDYKDKLRELVDKLHKDPSSPSNWKQIAVAVRERSIGEAGTGRPIDNLEQT